MHGAIVAWTILQKGQMGPWAMFLFGGVCLFLITQMHGLGLSRRGKLIIAAPLIAIMAAFYFTFPDLIGTLPRIPAINYIGTFLVFLIVLLLMRCHTLVQWLRTVGTVRSAS